jgi:chromosome segregation and condensation protein ScpB
MSQSPAENLATKQRQSPLLIGVLLVIATFALSQGLTLAMLHRVRGQVEDTNRKIQELEKKLDALNGRQRP